MGQKLWLVDLDAMAPDPGVMGDSPLLRMRLNQTAAEGGGAPRLLEAEGPNG